MTIFPATQSESAKYKSGAALNTFYTDAQSEISITKAQHLQATLTANPAPAAKMDAEKRLALATTQVRARAEANPQSLPVQNSAARFAMQVGDFKAAVGRAEKAVALAQTSGDPKAVAAAETTRAAARYASKDFAGACADAESILGSDERNVTAFEIRRFSCGRNAAGTLVSEFDVKKFVAQQAPGPVVAHTPEQWAENQGREKTAAFEGIANSMKARKGGDFAGALRYAEAAVLADGGDAMAYAQRGLARSDLGDFNGAILDLSQAIARGMVWNALYKLRGQALLKAGRYRPAAEDADLALVLDPQDASAYATRAMAKMGEGGVSARSILADLQAAARLDPGQYGGLLEKATRDLAATATAHSPQPALQAPVPWWARGRALIGGVAAVLLLLAVASWVLLRPAGAPSLENGLIGGYLKLGKKIGAGGMGTVYAAWDTNLERAVAVKRMSAGLRDDPEESARFIQEAKTVASLKHPNIVAIHDAFQDAGELYLVFELVRGQTLQQLVEGRGALPWEEALGLMAPICAALDYAHGGGVIHRDLKPANVMIEGGVLKVMDFGIARRTRSAELHTMTSQLIGTPAFMAPEQKNGEVSRESDLYALGVCAYYLLKGRLPLEGAPLSSDPVFSRALHQDRRQRFHSAAEFLQALRLRT